MSLAHRIARPLLAATFVTGGVEALRNPKPKVPAAEDVAPPVAQPIPFLPDDTEQLVKIDAGVKIVAGLMLATGRLPRLAALALCGSLVPTTLAGHRFWEEEDPASRGEQQIHFLKNVGLLGGLLFAALDTGGRPSVGWRARQAAQSARRGAQRQTKSVRRALPVD